MRLCILFAALCILTSSVASGQWLERTILLPDSLSGLQFPQTVELNTVNNTVFIADHSRPCAVVLDCSTGQKMARVELSGRVYDACFDPVRNKFYCLSQGLMVVDGSTYAVRRTIPMPTQTSEFIAYNQTAGKVYVGPYWSSRQPVVAVDCSADTVVGYIDIDSPGKFFCADPDHNKLFITWSDSSALAVVDCATDSIMKLVRLSVLPSVLLYNHISGKLYCAGQGQFYIIDAAGDSLLQSLPVARPVRQLGLNPVSNKVYCADRESQTVIVISGQGDSVLARVEDLGAESFTFDSLDNLMYCSCWDTTGGSFAVIDGRTDSLVATFKSSDFVEDMCYDPVFNRIYAGGNLVAVIDCAARAIVDSVILWLSPTSMCYCPNGDKVYFAACGENAVGVVDCSRNEMTRLIPVGELPRFVYYVEEVDKVYCANERDGTVSVIDCSTDSAVATLRVGAKPWDFCHVPQSGRLYCANLDDSFLTVIDLDGDSVIGCVQMAGRTEALAYSPESNRLYCALYWDSTLSVIDPGPDTVVGSVGVIGVTHILCFVPTTNELVCVGSFLGHALMVLDCASGIVTDTLWVGTGIMDIVYNPVRHKVFTADGTSWSATVVDCSTWQVDSFVGIEPPPTAIAYDSLADKVYVVSRSRFGRVTVIDGETNEVLT